MAKPYTVHVMKKDLETVQQQVKILMREIVDLKLKVSPESTDASELCAGKATESSENVEALVRADQDVIEKRLKTIEEQLEALKSSQVEHDQRFQPDKFIDRKDAKGMTPLHRAVCNHDITKITFLLKKGADVNIFFDAFIPLHHAADRGLSDVCALLILMGNTNVNALSENSKSTGLHFAAKKGHVKAMEVLLNCGADVIIKNIDGKTAYDIAVENKLTSVVEFLDSRC